MYKHQEKHEFTCDLCFASAVFQGAPETCPGTSEGWRSIELWDPSHSEVQILHMCPCCVGNIKATATCGSNFVQALWSEISRSYRERKRMAVAPSCTKHEIALHLIEYRLQLCGENLSIRGDLYWGLDVNGKRVYAGDWVAARGLLDGHVKIGAVTYGWMGGDLRWWLDLGADTYIMMADVTSVRLLQ
jgi:hypothetical protein